MQTGLPAHADFHTLVEREAKRICKRMPQPENWYQELVAFGHVGLAEARRRYDPSKSVDFAVFARHRVRGAIFDGLRKTGHFSRRAWQSVRREAIAHDVLGEPRAIGDRFEQVSSVRAAVEHLATAFLIEQACKSPAAQADERLELKEDLERMRAALVHLSARARETLTAVYDLKETGDSGAELARRIGVSRSTVSRRHRAALSALRAVFEVPA